MKAFITGLLVALAGSCSVARADIDLSRYSTNRPLQVMAIGDSITDDCSYNGAWRLYLQPLLQNNGYNFTFVGRQTSIGTRTFSEIRHEGYCGAVIAPPGVMPSPVHGYAGTNVYLLKIVADALTNVTPDLVLVVMGANDIGRGRDPFTVATNDMQHLLDIIWSNAPNAEIILTKTTSLSNAVIGYAAFAPNVPIYNAALQAMVNEKAAQGAKISLADMFSAVDYSTMFNSDHLHPNQVGLSAMAKEFLTCIELMTTQFHPRLATMIPAGATWKYSDVGQDLGTNWVRADYDDSGWRSGPARLGYGDQVAATTVSFGPDFKQKNPTTYFRYAFVVPQDVAFTNLNFRMASQDGAVVWLNGQEVFRTNMPGGAITYTNRALRRISGEASYIYYPTNIAVPVLPAGTNVVGVELHINSPVVPSIGFDMELLASGHVLPGPSLSVSVAGGKIMLSWSTAGAPYVLYSSSDPSNPTAWAPAPGLIQTNATQYSVAVSPDTSSRFFRLQKQ